MPLGDSLTSGVCWRALLWYKLNQNGHAGKFDFVGSRSTDDATNCGVPGYDKDNEGQPQYLVTYFIHDADEMTAGIQTPQDLLGRHPADVVLLHYGTFDIRAGVDPPTIVMAYSTVLAALRQVNPSVVVLVAQIVPMEVTNATCANCSCPSCANDVLTLNGMIPAWAAANTTAVSPIKVVDQWTGFTATGGVDTSDGVHPNFAGSLKMANKWYDAVAPYF
jgi:hypothetical protein